MPPAAGYIAPSSASESAPQTVSSPPTPQTSSTAQRACSWVAIELGMRKTPASNNGPDDQRHRIEEVQLLAQRRRRGGSGAEFDGGVHGLASGAIAACDRSFGS